MEDRTIGKLEYDPERVGGDEPPPAKLARLKAELDELKEFVDTKEVRGGEVENREETGQEPPRGDKPAGARDGGDPGFR